LLPFYNSKKQQLAIWGACIRILKTVLSVNIWLIALMLMPISGLAQTVEPSTAQLAIISEPLQAQLTNTSGPISFLVLLRDQVDADAVMQSAGATLTDRHAKAAALYAQLTATAQRTQAPLRAWLDAQSVPYRAFYLLNMIEVQGDSTVADALRRRPEVGRLIANPSVRQQLSTGDTQQTWLKTLENVAAQATPNRPYGLDYTHAPEVWALGFTGQGIVVASQDTGVDWAHPALQANYRGVTTATQTTAAVVDHAYNWFDAWDLIGRPASCAADAQVPCDDDGHGTHTVGTMVGDATAVGDAVLGMAPGAQWIGCRNMNNGVGTPASYTACFQFFLAPYPQGGDSFVDGQPALGPDVINNSWGCPPSEGCDADSLREVVGNVRAAGLLVVASAGNNGSSCSSVRDPIAIYDAVFSVGAHNSAGDIASFSSRGPVTIDGSRRLKPDISAPGVSVRSAWVGGNYNTISGTSMASPHVAGAVALLWSAVPTLTGQLDLTEQVLIKSATPVPFDQCDGSTLVIPNNTYGYGRLNVLAAVQLAQRPGSIQIRVLDRANQPLANTPVVLTDTLTGYTYTATSDGDGMLQFASIYAGAYTATVQLAGSAFTPLNIPLQAGESAAVDLQEQAPTAEEEEQEPQQTVWSLFFPLVTGD